jgi:hypothetical protein
VNTAERLRGLFADTETTCWRVALEIESALDADALDDDDDAAVAGKRALAALRRLGTMLDALPEIAARAHEERLEQDRRDWLAPRREVSP